MRQFKHISNRFLNQLRSLRRSWFLHTVYWVLCSFAVSAWGMVCIQFFVTGQVHGVSLLGGGAIWIVLWIAVMIKYRPTLQNYTRLYDRINKNNSRLQNGYDLCRSARDDEFTQWAIADSLKSISLPRSQQTFFKIKWTHWLIIQVVVLIVTWPVNSGVASNLPEVIENIAHKFQFTHSALGERQIAMPNVLYNPATTRLLGEVSSILFGKNEHPGTCRGIGQGNFMSHDSKLPVSPEKHSSQDLFNKGTSSAVTLSDFKFSGVSSGDNLNTSNHNAFNLNTPADSIDAEDFSRSERRPERKSRRPNQTPMNLQAASLNLSDQALPAGRDVASESGQKDDRDPTESPRGDGWGDKNNKEIAAALPVLPLVDSISGILDEGEELKQLVPSHSNFTVSYKKVGNVVSTPVEPALKHSLLPKPLRKINNLRKNYE